jgi:hypothetical protein
MSQVGTGTLKVHAWWRAVQVAGCGEKSPTLLIEWKEAKEKRKVLITPLSTTVHEIWREKVRQGKLSELVGRILTVSPNPF